MDSHFSAFAQRDEATFSKQSFCILIKNRGVVTSVEMVEKNGDRTIIELKNIKKNETIANNMFDFH